MQVLNWNDKPQVVKGDFAEEIVHDFLENKGFIVYKPITNGAHSFDRLAIKGKKQVVICEIKAKAKLNKYDETGINARHYKEYKVISEQHNIPIFIFFVDEMLGEIYGNWLSILEKQMRDSPPHWGEQLKLFRMCDMQRGIYMLNEEQVLFLKQNSTRNYEYGN